MSKYHPLTEILWDNLQKDKDEWDKDLREWLTQKAHNIATNLSQRSLEGGGYMNITEKELDWQEKMLELTEEKTLEDKIVRYYWDGNTIIDADRAHSIKKDAKNLAQIMKQHFKGGDNAD